MTYPRNWIKKLSLEQDFGKPRVKNTQRKAQNQDIVEGIVDVVSQSRAQGLNGGTDNGAEPLGEGADVWTEKSVDGIDEGMVRAEPAVGKCGQGQTRAHRVH